MTSEGTPRRLSRRRFLGAVGTGVGAVALDPAEVTAARCAANRHPRAARTDHFGRIFRLPPFAGKSARVEAALVELGKPGGLLDANDPLAAGPKQLIVDLSLSANNPNNPSHPAGTTFFGQFLDHDITFDASSRLAQPTSPEEARNFRTPALDLDSVYGAGPVADQALYDPADHIKLKVESGGLRGPAASRGRRRDRRRPAERREPDHRRAALRVPALPQPRGRLRAGQGASRGTGECLRGGAPADDVALPLAGAARVPAGARRAGDGRRRAPPRTTLVPSRHWGGAHPGRVSDRDVSGGAQHGATLVPCQPRRRQRPGVLRLHLRPVAGGRDRSSRSARRLPCGAPVRRLADLLRLRRRPGEAEQEARHQDLDAALQLAPGCDRKPRCAHVARAAQPAPAPHLEASVGPERRARG